VIILKKLIHTKSFLFEKAQYVLSDGKGNSLLLIVDYKNNKHKDAVVKKNGGGYMKLQKEAGKVAKDLLERKHKINFVRSI
jgi:hypothetical protein